MSYIIFFTNLKSDLKNNPIHQIWAWSGHYLENYFKFLHFSIPKNEGRHWKQKVPMATSQSNNQSINEHCQCRQNVAQRRKLKSQNFISLSCGVLELLRKTSGEGGESASPSPGIDRVNGRITWCDSSDGFFWISGWWPGGWWLCEIQSDESIECPIKHSTSEWQATLSVGCPFALFPHQWEMALTYRYYNLAKYILCTIYLERAWELNNYLSKLYCVSVL